MEDKKQIIIDFLQKCNGYSEQMLVRYEEEAGADDAAAVLKAKQKIHDWTSYREFNIHAIGELNDGTLDAWF
ncbi:MAG: hypothetical protein A6F70_00345 [Cycloclasticus sp. symbiont of Bathymodiolus heckerae]|nr:MAG: hypothetical protein A6F70_00345 [Cycloclasticus sp. symbiont of Bathymodiolus heckerae]